MQEPGQVAVSGYPERHAQGRESVVYVPGQPPVRPGGGHAWQQRRRASGRCRAPQVETRSSRAAGLRVVRSACPAAEEGRTVSCPGIGSLSAQVSQPQRVVRTGGKR